MINRHRTVRFILAVLSASWLLQFSAAHAEQAFQRFLPLFVDLDGWQGKKPDGMSMEMSNTSMTTATRDYQRGAAQLHASVIMGQAAAAALARFTGHEHQVPGGVGFCPRVAAIESK